MPWSIRKSPENYRTVKLSPDSDSDEPQKPRQQTLHVLIFLNLMVIASVLAGIFILRQTILNRHVAQNTTVLVRHCGNSPSEARARGCLFESSNLAWIPPECYDKEINDEWNAKHWAFAYGSEKQTISQEEVLTGDLDHVWVTWSQHISHCALMALKFQRAVQFNWPMDNWTTSYGHSLHCAKSYTEWEYMKTPEKLNSKIFLKFPICDYGWQDMMFKKS